MNTNQQSGMAHRPGAICAACNYSQCRVLGDPEVAGERAHRVPDATNTLAETALLERAVEAAIVTLRAADPDAAGVAAALEVRLKRHRDRASLSTVCTCGHAALHHQDPALAPECLACACSQFSPRSTTANVGTVLATLLHSAPDPSGWRAGMDEEDYRELANWLVCNGIDCVTSQPGEFRAE